MQAIDFRKAPMVLLDDSRPAHRAGRSLLFHSPEKVIVAWQLEDLAEAFTAMDQAVAQGFHLAGWVAYECAAYFEPRLRPHICTAATEPLAWMMVTRHRQRLDSVAVARALDDARRGTHRQANLTMDLPAHDETAYRNALDRVHDYIRAGDVYQINHTFPLPCHLEGDALALYERLRATQPVPFGAYIDTGPDHGKRKILSLSPELFVRRDGTRLTGKPMKGTAPRGLTHARDLAIEEQLGEDEKSRAENLMIVDLIRNDLSRISKPGSVAVPRLFETERYPSLFQMTSTVEAEAGPNLQPSTLLGALFPCGSVTGAPKVRAMEIIAELEPAARGIYCGAIGHFSPATNGADWTLNVPIRTLILDKKGYGRLNVGSGVVADSLPDGEYEECLLKARFIHETPQHFSLIETLRLDENGNYHLLDGHLERLKASAAHFDFPFDAQYVRDMLEEHRIDCSPSATRRVRLLLGESGAVTITSIILENTQAERAASVCLSATTTRSDDPFLFHKTTNRTLYNKAFTHARTAGFDDILFFNERSELTEGAISNVFIVEDGRWYTPPLECGLLDGVLRRSLLDSGEPRITERVIRHADLMAADEIHIGNSVRGLRRVSLHVDRL